MTSVTAIRIDTCQYQDQHADQFWEGNWIYVAKRSERVRHPI